ncbi:hypothetical protein HMPREF1990_00522 [Porphyromonas gingivalis W4087]|nr:hypothetical protein HMPREF1988_00413 [Porphyromonas gingivalis F0185]ERJ90687.1 hypothetical protein HMPREF1990_00522 [Porphyromonas gingivalis W4087]
MFLHAENDRGWQAKPVQHCKLNTYLCNSDIKNNKAQKQIANLK